MEEKIDILIATYNGEKYIEEQLNSILNQTYKNINILISDDCSKDETLNILQKYANLYSNISVFTHEKNLGYKKNFEFLLSKVESKYYMLCDQDDIWLPKKIELSYKKMIEDDADLVYCDLIVVDENLKEINNSYWNVIGIKNKVKYDDIRSLYLNNCVTGCTLLSKSKYIKDIIPIPDDSIYMLHDYWIALVVALKGKITHLDEKCIKYRQHTNNQIGSSKKSLKMKSFKDVRDLYIKIKIEHFNIFKRYDDMFDDKYKKLNIEALNYYNNISSKKYINFKGYNTFHKLYKYEKLSTYIIQFIVMNLPFLGYIGFFFVKLFVKRKDK